MGKSRNYKIEDLEEIGKENNIILNQGVGMPLFLEGKIFNIDDDSNFGIIQMEVDTGSDRSLMGLKLAKKLGLHIRGFKISKKIVGVGGIS